MSNSAQTRNRPLRKWASDERKLSRTWESKGMSNAKALRRFKMCERKKAFPTMEAAYQKGQGIYYCGHCGQWHRSGSLATLAAKVRGKK